MHASRVSTEIDDREKPHKKPKPEKEEKKRGLPRKGEEQLPEPTRIERQMIMTLEDMAEEDHAV